MGACNDELYLDGNLTTAQVKKRFEEYQDECGHESGNSYSGRLNMCPGLTFTGKTFQTEEEAYEYVNENAQKWENALAVQYYEKGRAPKPFRADKFNTELNRLRGDLNALNGDIRAYADNKLKTLEFISCGNCHSRLDTRFRTRTLKCPVCDASFATTAMLKKRATLEKKILALEQKLKAEYRAAQDKHNKKTKGVLKWLIYGMCSS